MRGLRFLGVPAALCLALWIANCQPHTAAARDEGEASLDQLLQAAFQTELDGDFAERDRLIKQALQIDPLASAARWQRGETRHGKQWLTATELQQAWQESHWYREYLRLTDAAGGGLTYHLQAARWCRRNGLSDEENYHWRFALELDPSCAEARRALGVRPFEGKLLTHDQIDALLQSRQTAEQHFQSWSNRFVTLVGALSSARDQAIKERLCQELEEAATLQSIPAMAAHLLGHDEMVDLAALRVLQRFPQQSSTELLTQLAVASTFAEVRHRAASLLRERRLHDYAPYLLNALQHPYETDVHISIGRSGFINYSHFLARDTPLFHEEVSYFGTASFAGPTSAPAWSLPVNIVVPRPQHDWGYQSFAHRQWLRFAAVSRELEAQVTSMNDIIADVNGRVMPVLKQITGQPAETPNQWWKWWNEYNHVVMPRILPTLVDVRQVTLASCFPLGTPVWTKRGNVPIESIRPGDFVFSQDLESGELSFKPVLATTVRDTTTTVTLQIGGETLCATSGHPFWVTGYGWRMARFLEDGMSLRTLNGSMAISGVTSGMPAPAFNLVVDTNHNYFVGESAVLVHDNTYRKPTLVTIPGYTPVR